MEARPLGCELHEHRHRAVVLRRRCGEEAVRDLALHHHAPEPHVRQAVEALDDDRRSDVVRQVGHELRRVLRQLEVERVAVGDLDVGAEASEHRLELAVDLDRAHARHALGEVAREHAVPRADLEDDVVGPQLGEPADHVEDVPVGQEVLAVFLLHSPKHAVALRSTCSPSSPASSPRESASAATVCTP